MKNIGVKYEKIKSNTVPMALIFGGVGKERDISAKGAANLLTLAEKFGIPLIPVAIDARGEWNIYIGNAEALRIGGWDKKCSLKPIHIKVIDGESYICGEYVKPVLVSGFFPLLHGDFGEDGTLQGMLETLGHKFIGCKTLCGAISTDKIFAKMAAEAVGVKTLPYFLYLDGKAAFRAAGGKIAFTYEDAYNFAHELGFPVFVKPSGLGSSFGAGIAHNRDELFELIKYASSAADGRVLIEAYLAGRRELEVAFFHRGKDAILTHPGEITYDSGFYGYSEKYEKPKTRLHIKADIEESVAEKILCCAKRIAALFELRHIGRIDFFLSEGEVYFNEVNPTPGLTESSLYLKMLGAAGISEREFLESLAVRLSEDSL